MASLTVKVLEADLRAIEDLLPTTLCGGSPQRGYFVSLRVVQSVGSKQCSTAVKENTCRPLWEEEFSLTVEEENSELELVLYNFDSVGHQFVGSTVVSLGEMESGEAVDEWYTLMLHPQFRTELNEDAPPVLLRVQMMLATFRWEKLPPRPIDFRPEYRGPRRAQRICCSAPTCSIC